MLEGGTANHGNVLDIPCGIKPYSTPAWRYKVWEILSGHKFSFFVVVLLSVTLHLNLTWKS